MNIEVSRDHGAMGREALLTVSDLLGNTLDYMRKTDRKSVEKFEGFIARRAMGLVVIIDEDQSSFVRYDEIIFSASERTEGEQKVVRTLVVNANSEFSLNDRVVFSEMQKAVLDPFMKGGTGMKTASGEEMMRLLKSISPPVFGVRRQDHAKTPIFFAYARP